MKYLLYYCFFILIIFFFAYINSKPSEAFTTMINGYYRPIIRTTRLAAEGFYNKAADNVNECNRSINNFFARFGFS
jgi:hypothetical protein